MRHRATILFLLACLLAVVPVMQSNAAQATCTQQDNGSDEGNLFSGVFGDSNGCADGTPPAPLWVRGMTFLSVLCLGASALTGAFAWRDRRRETELLRGAGIPVREQDLPLE